MSALRVSQSPNDSQDDLKLTIDSMESVEADPLLLLATLGFRLCIIGGGTRIRRRDGVVAIQSGWEAVCVVLALGAQGASGIDMSTMRLDQINLPIGYRETIHAALKLEVYPANFLDANPASA